MSFRLSTGIIGTIDINNECINCYPNQTFRMRGLVTEIGGTHLFLCCLRHFHIRFVRTGGTAF